ncbi:hypothetical protein CONPUDRAFT_133933 [Coniophora puteana RWD-64-598 SS2]|uniref:Uncharacterized protein n=1 Tax=Coniophora puteana (strain RWD-64-598) TaxID=741705 RepID=A0A5M3N547_CONPW|nr:uncharacterized protein CONPUDRAFT_133933 [Coniophora puteana RWD-64-598 SS2]EIW86513.1 hypothetical protein CONPUDRAFT_133933 [Coniophora puteana RWD-64-598 SS2]
MKSNCWVPANGLHAVQGLSIGANTGVLDRRCGCDFVIPLRVWYGRHIYITVLLSTTFHYRVNI